MTPRNRHRGRRREVASARLAVARAGALFLILDATGLVQREAAAQTGRRLLVEVANGVLQAQGVNAGAADGAPSVRPYVNVIHDHWRNIYPDPTAGLEPYANSLLPDFVVPANSTVQGHELTLTLLGAQKWVDPPEVLPLGHIPLLQPLAAGETIRVETVNGDVSSDAPGSLLLSVSVPARGIDDLLLRYATNRLPSEEIDVLTFRLSARPADPSKSDLIADSGPIFVLLTPDGANSPERWRHAALFLEAHLAQPVPEPHSCLLAGLSLAALMRLRGVESSPGAKM